MLLRVATNARRATVTLDRPGQRNALSIAMLEELTRAFGDLAVEPDIRVVVLDAAGPDFCAGADFAELEQARRDGSDGLDFDRPFRDALNSIAAHPVPVVARVHGRALGGGCQLALACDLAVAAEDARLGIPSARLGIVIPIESIERLVSAVGPKRAGEMLLAGAIVDGPQAMAWGLVGRAVSSGELDGAVDEIAAAVVAAAPLSIRAAKRGIGLVLQQRAARRGRTGDFDMMAAAAFQSEDLAEGIRAFRERRAPRFEGR